MNFNFKLNAVKSGKYYGDGTIAKRSNTQCCFCGREDCSTANPYIYVGHISGSPIYACSTHAKKAFIGKPFKAHFKGAKTVVKTTLGHNFKVVTECKNLADFICLGFGFEVKAKNKKYVIESDVQYSCYSLGHLPRENGKYLEICKVYINLADGNGWQAVTNEDEYKALVKIN